MKLLATCLVVFAFSAALSLGGEEKYHQEFLRAFGTNDWSLSTPVVASLADTNNTGRKITNAVIDLKGVMASGGVSGVRLGMSMDELVARWGKPPGLYIINSDGWFSGVFRAARLRYADVEVQFEPATNAIKMLFFDPRPLRFASDLTPRSTTNDAITVLGRLPVSRMSRVFDYLLYRLPRWAMSGILDNEDTSQLVGVERSVCPGRSVKEVTGSTWANPEGCIAAERAEPANTPIVEQARLGG